MAKTLELIDTTSEEELRALMHRELKEKYGEDYFKMLYSMDESILPMITEVRGRPPHIEDILYVSWYETNFLNFDNFKNLRQGEVSGFIPQQMALLISRKRSGRLEALRALVGEAMEKARSAMHLKGKG